MTDREAIEILQNEKECVKRANVCDRECRSCDLVRIDKDILDALDMGIKAFEERLQLVCKIAMPEEEVAKLGAFMERLMKGFRGEKE